MCDRAHWLMLRESLFSLYRSWNSLPEITVVSDGSWTANEFAEVFAWWPTPITVLMREEICLSALAAGFPELADYVRESIWGLELATVTTQAKQRPVLYADADILWFRDPRCFLVIQYHGKTSSATRKQLPSAARHGAAALPEGVGATIC